VTVQAADQVGQREDRRLVSGRGLGIETDQVFQVARFEVPDVPAGHAPRRSSSGLPDRIKEDMPALLEVGEASSRIVRQS